MQDALRPLISSGIVLHLLEIVKLNCRLRSLDVATHDKANTRLLEFLLVAISASPEICTLMRHENPRECALRVGPLSSFLRVLKLSKLCLSFIYSFFISILIIHCLPSTSHSFFWETCKQSCTCPRHNDWIHGPMEHQLVLACHENNFVMHWTICCSTPSLSFIL